MHYLWRVKRYKVYSGKHFFKHYCLQLSFIYKTMSQISFNLFWLGDKGFYQSFLGNEVDFGNIMNVSPNILSKNQNFKKLRQDFVDKRTMSTTTLTSSCHWETVVPFCLKKKIPESTFLTLTVNSCKIVQKKYYAIQNNIKLAI